jgi:peptidoglycan hydrolase FlgJ
MQISPMGAQPSPRDVALLHQAKALEASFLSEMLGHAGLGDAREAFGGGAGEEQFTSFLRQEQAKQMVEKGGIGLAEHLFRALNERADHAK